ncbi:MAG: type IV pili methyl-accepting chemotaxis transducer N-terminal domain-containing protein [Pseudomonadota bacterium]|nr:type IV pili methyl-accepting chemotaxis transducer N-terminal domain-containing protein [Pseudomonadota bacterium]
MRKQIARLIPVALMGLFLAVGSQAATKEEMGVTINLAGKQRMLTQKMSKEALLIAKGIDADANKASLEKTAALFDTTLAGLAAGDASLGLPETTDPAILEQLEVVRGQWVEFKGSIGAVLGGDTSTAVSDQIAQQNLPLLKEMNKAVQMYTKASGSTLDPAVATTINLAGKQRMLTQKMTKELLLVANGIDADTNKANLAKTVALFQRTLTGLLDGDADLGLPGTKDQAIRDQLAAVQGLWDQYKPVLDAVDTSDAGLAKAAKLNLPLLKEMNITVKMYEQSAK